MESAIFRAKSKTELKLLMDLAKKLGIRVKWLTREDLEDYGLARAIKLGKSGQLLDTEKFLKSIE